MIGTAWAADAPGGGGGLFSDPTFWVAVAFFLFLAIAGKQIVKGLTKLLDDRTALIARTLGEAEKLRNEAQKARDDAQKSLADSARLAQEIVAQARQEAERLTQHAAEERETLIGRREQQARDRIAQAEAQASREVRNMAVDVALAATRTLAQGAGRRRPHTGDDRRGHRRTAAPSALIFQKIGIARKIKERATWCPRRKAGAFSCPIGPSVRLGNPERSEGSFGLRPQDDRRFAPVTPPPASADRCPADCSTASSAGSACGRPASRRGGGAARRAARP